MLLPAAASADDHSLPDRQLTPGAIPEIVPAFAAKCPSKLTAMPINPGEPITRKMICETGYSKCVRRVTKADKTDVFARYELKGNRHGLLRQ
ncbi:MAG: hypothetical protein ACLPKB_34290 [Xanthobacteraceae bacterium]